MNLQDGARSLGLTLDEGQLAAFDRYRSELMAWNERFNLTAITEPGAIDSKHFLDSLSCLTALSTLDGQPVARWLSLAVTAVDVGAGAGFPALPIKIVWPKLRLTLLEANGKKCRFLRHVASSLALEDVTVAQDRAETFGQGAGRAAFDLALARAVAPLAELLEYALPLLRTGGWLLAQKGGSVQGELDAAQAALETLGGRWQATVPVSAPGLEIQRTIVIVAKTAATPARYPRRPGIPHKRPLP